LRKERELYYSKKDQLSESKKRLYDQLYKGDMDEQRKVLGKLEDQIIFVEWQLENLQGQDLESRCTFDTAKEEVRKKLVFDLTKAKNPAKVLKDLIEKK